MGRKRDKKNASGSAGLNKKEGEDFLRNNAKKPEVIETASGLQYTTIREGEGMTPRWDSTVVIEQRATLLNGTVLIDTYKEGRPSEFKLSEGIEGLQEGITLIEVGARYKFWVPWDLGWGKKGSSSKIGPYATLVFDVALLETD